MIADRDFIYENLPWRAGGRTREGLDCAGLALLFLREEFGLDVTAPDTTQPACFTPPAATWPSRATIR